MYREDYDKIINGYRSATTDYEVNYYEYKWRELCQNKYFIHWIIKTDVELMEKESKEFGKALDRVRERRICMDKLNSYRQVFNEIMEDKNSRKRRNLRLANLMTQMENEFRIPALNDEEYNKENKEIIELYREISNARVFD